MIDIDELEGQSPEGWHAKERHVIEIERKRLELIEGEQVLRDSEREFMRFAGQALACRRAIGLSDDQVMPEVLRERLDAEFWEYQVKSMAAIDFITTGRLSRNTVELIAATRAETRQRLTDAILRQESHDLLVDWYLSHEPEMPEPVSLTMPARDLVKCGSERLLSRQPNGIPADVLSNPEPITEPA